MIAVGLDEKVYPALKLAMIVDSLAAEGISANEALEGVGVAQSALNSAATRVSVSQALRCCANAIRLVPTPGFAYRTGMRSHLSSYGMYGFAAMSSTDFHKTMAFLEQYHELAAPLSEIHFNVEGAKAIWTVSPVVHPLVDASLYRFLVELQFGINVANHQQIFGPTFAVTDFEVSYGLPESKPDYPRAFGAWMNFNCPANRMIFDAAWLDTKPKYGDSTTYGWVKAMCDDLLKQMSLHVGLQGEVRSVLMRRMAQPPGLEEVAGVLHMSPRTLRRRLVENGTSFRALSDELRMNVSLKYLRETKLTTESIAAALGFSDAANFRQAFKRWTGRSPADYRAVSREERPASVSAGSKSG